MAAEESVGGGEVSGAGCGGVVGVVVVVFGAGGGSSGGGEVREAGARAGFGAGCLAGNERGGLHDIPPPSKHRCRM